MNPKETFEATEMASLHNPLTADITIKLHSNAMMRVTPTTAVFVVGEPHRETKTITLCRCGRLNENAWNALLDYLKDVLPKEV